MLLKRMYKISSWQKDKPNLSILNPTNTFTATNPASKL